MARFIAALAAALLAASAAAAAPAQPVHAAAAPLPSDRLHFGLANGPGSLGWMTASGVPWKYRYTYLAGGLYSNPWPTWQDPALPPGQYALDYMRSSAGAGYIPVLPYYMLLQSHRAADEAADDYANLNNTSLMRDYYANFTLLMEKAGEFGGQVLVIVEPDLWGYRQQRSGNTVASAVSASVSSSGDPDLAGYPNTVQGFAEALQHLRDTHAANALLAFHASMWSSGRDVATDTDPALDPRAEADRTAAFFNSASPAGWDVVTDDVDDHDAGWWEATGGDSAAFTHWWDPSNTRVPDFARYLAWVGELHARTGRPQVAWQVPLGNQYYLTEDNTWGHYQDNVLPYFLAHPLDLFDAGLVAVLVGAGNAGQTTNEDTAGDGVTNGTGSPVSDAAGFCSSCNTHSSSYPDDDGGYARVFVGQYYASAWPPAAAPAGVLHPLPPARVLDTRTGLGGMPRLASGQRAELDLRGVAGVPAGHVTSVVLNVTAAGADAAGFLAVYPGGTSWPGNSNVNFVPGAASTNLVEAPVGPDGRIAFANGSAGGVDVVGDVFGWTSDSPAGPSGLLRPVPPVRVADTRNGTGGHVGPVEPGVASAITVAIAGQGGVPASGASAAVLNVTAVNPAAGGFLAVYPAGSAWPGSSNVNFAPGQTIPNRVIVPLGAGGAVTIAASTATDVIVDVGGWFTDASVAGSSTGAFATTAPARLLDTRASGGSLGPGGHYSLAVGGSGGVPAGASAVALNVTATGATSPSFVAVYPDGSAWATTSDLNLAPGLTSTNLVIVKLGAGGRVDFANASGATDLIVDLVGWFG